MKLLILTTYYPPEVNAASVRISQITKRFIENDDKKDIQIAVFNPLYNRNIEPAIDSTGINVRRYWRKALPSFIFVPQSINPINLIYWIRITANEIAKFNPDLVLTSSPPFAPAISIYIVSKLFGNNISYIIDYRDDLTSVINSIAESKTLIIRWILKGANKFMSYMLFRSLNKASIVSTVNEVLQKNLLDLNKNVILVPNGLDLRELNETMRSCNRVDVLRNIGISDINSKIIVYLGDLNVPYHRPEMLLEHIDKINKLGNRLIYVIIGDGKRKKLIEKMITDMNLQNIVYLIGKRTHSEAMKILLASDVAFYCSQSSYPQSKHAIGTKVYEYVGCKLPMLVVANEGDAISNFVEQWGIGYFVSWNSLEKMDEALLDLIQSDKYKENLQKNYQSLIDKFDRNRGIDILYKEITKFSNIGSGRG